VKARQPQARVVLVQMEAPPNLGATYTREFRGVFRRVSEATGAVVTPFLLDGVAGVAGLNQADGIHPTEAGAVKAARTVWPVLRGVLDSARGRVPAL
jgi:acyl-CoA thioesterase I